MRLNFREVQVNSHLGTKMFTATIEDVVRWEEEGLGKAKRKNHRITAFTLNPPPVPPSNSIDSAAAISIPELRANAGVSGTMSYQRFSRHKVRGFSLRMRNDKISSAPSWSYRGPRLGYGITVTA